MGFFEGLMSGLQQAQQAQIQRQQVQRNQQETQAGQGLGMALFGGGQGQQRPPMAPQPLPPGGGGPNPMGPPQRAGPQPVPPLGGQGGIAQGAPPPAPMGGPPQMPQGGGGGGLQPGQKLDFESAVQLIKNNPQTANLPPGTKFEMLGRLVPIMNAQAMQQYKMLAQQIQLQRANEQERHNTITEGQGQEKIGNLKEDREARHAQWREQFDLAKEKLSQAKTEKDRTAAMKQIEDANREYDQATKNEITSAGSLGADQLGGVRDEQAARAKGAKARLDTLRGGAAPAAAAPSAAGGHQPGETITVGTKKYRYKGGDWDSKASFEAVP